MIQPAPDLSLLVNNITNRLFVLLLAVNGWFVRRLVASIDALVKTSADHSERIARLEGRIEVPGPGWGSYGPPAGGRL